MKSIPLSCTGWLLFFSICFQDDAYKIRSVFRIKEKERGKQTRKKKDEERSEMLMFSLH